VKKSNLAGKVRTLNASLAGILASASVEQGGLINRLGFWLMAASFIAALLVLFTTPMLAYRWAKQPFPGFMVEQTLIVSSISGEGWGAASMGISPLYHVTYVNEQPVPTAEEYNRILAGLKVGGKVSVRMTDQEGNQYHYLNIPLQRFPQADLVRLFWLPYLIGLVYLAIAVWVYRVRGNTRAGRTFVSFLTLSMLIPVLVFDISTTHRWTALYTISIALLGGTMINLAILFPAELRPILRRFWLRIAAYGASLVLIIWGLGVLYSRSNPWAYIANWRFDYSYTGIGLLVFYMVLYYRLRTDVRPVVRQQARIILWGGMLAFTPVGVWMIGPQITGVDIPWNPAVFLPLLLIFPISIGAAIVRYHMWDIDFIIRGTLAYTILTVTLAVLYFGFVIGLGVLFQGVAGNSQAVIVIATLAIVALANPLRKWLQAIIDRRFYRKKYDAEKTLAEFSLRLRYEVDQQRITEDLLAVVEETVQPEYVSLWLIPPVQRSDESPERTAMGRDSSNPGAPLDIFRRKSGD
jgi:hypothetical protein